MCWKWWKVTKWSLWPCRQLKTCLSFSTTELHKNYSNYLQVESLTKTTSTHNESQFLHPVCFVGSRHWQDVCISALVFKFSNWLFHLYFILCWVEMYSWGIPVLYFQIENYLLRNHETRKYLQEQAYRLQQGIVTSTTQQVSEPVLVTSPSVLNWPSESKRLLAFESFPAGQ